MFSDNTSIHRYVVSEPILNCIKLIRECKGPHSQLVAVNTDGIYGNTVYMYGEPNQCQPVGGGSAIHYDCLESESIRETCPKTQTLKYIEDSCRYDRKTHEMLNRFLKHGKITTYIKPVGKYYKNICFVNSTRITVNKKCCDNFYTDKKYMDATFKYNNGRETYKVCMRKYMPVMASQNLKDSDIYNTMEFVISDIKNSQFKISDMWFSL